MKTSATLRDRLGTLLADDSAERRLEALRSLEGVKVGFVTEALRLILALSPDDPLGDEIKVVLGKNAPPLKASSRPPEDPVMVAFRDADSRHYPLGPLGAGPLGRVYLSVQVSLRRLVALKVFHASLGLVPGTIQRALGDLQSLARLSHPSLLAIHDAGIHDGRLFVATELAEGQSLRSILDHAGPIPWTKALEVARSLASLLVDVHEQGIAHHRIKPANVFVGSRGVKLNDFGLPHGVLAPQKKNELSAAAACYRSPEEALGGASDARSDLFAIGVMIHEMLLGKLPFEGANAVTVAMKQLNGPTPALPDFLDAPPRLREIAVRLLAPRPSDRVASAQQLLEMLDELWKTMPRPQAPERTTRRRVLVVDDSPEDSEALGSILTEGGFTVTFASTSAQAKSLLEAESSEAVLTELVFKDGTTGIDLITDLKRDHPSIPVLAMSGAQDEGIWADVLGRGISAILPKPLDGAEVLAAVGQACRKVTRSLILVDDDRLVRLVLRRVFESEGYTARACANLVEAKAQIEKEVPDVVVCDLRIKDESGLDLLEHVRKNYQAIAFVMISATPEAPDVIRAFHLGVCDFVVKSENVTEVIKAVEKAITRRPAGSGGPDSWTPIEASVAH